MDGYDVDVFDRGLMGACLAFSESSTQAEVLTNHCGVFCVVQCNVRADDLTMDFQELTSVLEMLKNALQALFLIDRRVALGAAAEVITASLLQTGALNRCSRKAEIGKSCIAAIRWAR